jgi:hypothetical protein
MQKTATFGIIVILFIAICLAIFIGGLGSIETNPANKTSPTNLESVLYQLSQSSNPVEFAKNHDIEVKDNRVRVIIELKNQTDTISPRFNITIESSDKNLVQALVPISNLIELSDEPYVNFIRTPLRPYVGSDKTPVKTTNYDSFFLSLLGISISLLLLVRKLEVKPK